MRDKSVMRMPGMAVMAALLMVLLPLAIAQETGTPLIGGQDNASETEDGVTDEMNDSPDNMTEEGTPPVTPQQATDGDEIGTTGQDNGSTGIADTTIGQRAATTDDRMTDGEQGVAAAAGVEASTRAASEAVSKAMSERLLEGDGAAVIAHSQREVLMDSGDGLSLRAVALSVAEITPSGAAITGGATTTATTGMTSTEASAGNAMGNSTGTVDDGSDTNATDEEDNATSARTLGTTAGVGDNESLTEEDNTTTGGTAGETGAIAAAQTGANASAGAAGNASEDMVRLCHVSQSENGNLPAETIEVSGHAVETHFNHGDSLGACDDRAGEPVLSTQASSIVEGGGDTVTSVTTYLQVFAPGPALQGAEMATTRASDAEDTTGGTVGAGDTAGTTAPDAGIQGADIQQGQVERGSFLNLVAQVSAEAGARAGAQEDELQAAGEAGSQAALESTTQVIAQVREQFGQDAVSEDLVAEAEQVAQQVGRNAAREAASADNMGQTDIGARTGAEDTAPGVPTTTAQDEQAEENQTEGGNLFTRIFDGLFGIFRGDNDQEPEATPAGPGTPAGET